MLMGWYLIMPPASEMSDTLGNKGAAPRAEWQGEHSAPLQLWQRLMAFDSAAACEAARIDPDWRLERLRQDIHVAGPKPLYLMSRCITSDDPALR